MKREMRLHLPLLVKSKSQVRVFLEGSPVPIIKLKKVKL